MAMKKKSSSEECPPQADRYINSQDDNWGLKQNVCPLDSPKVSTQNNSSALENANRLRFPVYDGTGSIAKSTSQGRK